MTYPPDHQSTVTALLREGRFLLQGESSFLTLREHADFYTSFFRESFDLELQLTPEYALLKSGQPEDRLARAICIYLAVLCYELEREGKNILETLHSGTFSIPEWEVRFKQSSFINVLDATDQLRDADQRRKFYLRLSRRGIIERTSDTLFRFTPAHRYFLDFAREINAGEILVAKTKV